MAPTTPEEHQRIIYGEDNREGQIYFFPDVHKDGLKVEESTRKALKDIRNSSTAVYESQKPSMYTNLQALYEYSELSKGLFYSPEEIHKIQNPDDILNGKTASEVQARCEYTVQVKFNHSEVLFVQHSKLNCLLKGMNAFERLVVLNLDGCTNLTSLEPGGGATFHTTHCKYLAKLRELSLKGCSGLKNLPRGHIRNNIYFSLFARSKDHHSSHQPTDFLILPAYMYCSYTLCRFC